MKPDNGTYILAAVFLLLSLGSFSYYPLLWQESRVTSDASSSFMPSLVSNGSSLFIAYEDDRNGNFDLYLSIALLNGSVLSESPVVFTPSTSLRPSLLFFNSSLFLVYSDNRSGNSDIFLSIISPNGTVLSESQLTSDSSSQSDPSAVVANNTLFVVYSDNRNGNSDIYVSSAYLNGTPINEARITSDASNSNSPVLLSNSTSLFAIYKDDRNSYQNVYMSVFSFDFSLKSEYRLTNSSSNSVSPRAIFFNSSIYVAYDDDRNGNYDIYLTIASPNGTVLNESGITSIASDQYSSWLANGSMLYAVYQDDRNGNRDLYASTIYPNGTVANESQITSDPSDSSYPRAIFSGNALYVAYVDSRNVNFDIYLASSALVMPDLYASSISFSSSSPTADDVITVNGTVFNLGNSSADSVNVSFFRNGTLFNSSIVNLLPNSNSSVVVSLNTSGMSGVYNISLIADPSGSIQELNESNNAVSGNITVYPREWAVSPSNISFLLQAGSTVSSSVNVSLVLASAHFNLSVSKYEPSSSMLSFSPNNLSLFNASNLSSVFFNVTANSSIGTYLAVLSFSNSSAHPAQLNATVLMQVANLSASVLSPTASSNVSNVSAGMGIPISLDVSLNSTPLDSSVNFSVLVGNVSCPISFSSFNSSSGLWALNCTAPLIPLNPVSNALSVSAVYASPAFPGQNITVAAVSPDSVIYRDIAPPVFSSASISSVEVNESDFANGTINVSAMLYVNVTDNLAMSSVWVVVSHAGSIISTLNLSNVSSLWSANVTDLTSYGDYDVIIYANDSTGLVSNRSVWFDVFMPSNFSGNLTANGTNVPAVLLFYRAGTSYLMNNFSTSLSNASYSQAVHRRLYDVNAAVFGHNLTFFSVNMTNVPSLVNGISFEDYSTDTERGRITGFSSLLVRDRPLVGFYVNVSFNYTNASLTLNYTRNFNSSDSAFFEGGVSLFKCSAWVNRSVCASSWVQLKKGPDLLPNGTFTHQITASSPSTSFFMAAETTCGNSVVDAGETCSNCPADAGACPGTGGSTGGGGGGGSSSSSISLPPAKVNLCGNGVCDSGENSENCVKDCGVKGVPSFSLRSSLGEASLFPGDNVSYPVWVTNNLGSNITVSLSMTGAVANLSSLDRVSLKIDPRSVESSVIRVSVPAGTPPGVFKGEIVGVSGNDTLSLPVSVVVSGESGDLLDVSVELLSSRLVLNSTAKFHVILYNLGFKKKFDVNLTYLVHDTEKQRVLYSVSDNVSLETSASFFREVPLDGELVPVGEYYLEVLASYGDRKNVSATASFEVVDPFWTGERLLLFAAFVVVLVVVVGGYYVRRWYLEQKLSKARYVFPLDYSKLPVEGESAFWIGRVAETDRRAWFDPDDLVTHVLVAGSTGSGKSVSASIMVEEALVHKVPVVIFDPTAQWTGFVRPCKDRNLLDKYKDFGMVEDDAKPFKGMIFEVTDPNLKIDFKKYMNPGEVTVFTLNRLKPGEYDKAVQAIVATIFEQGWEESPNLRLLLVFDEVHRLLEKYGGSGGYVALEKACREFRKWGIGLIMASQVSTDFKEAVQGNILTEIQMNTKSIEDIKKMEEKYGAEFARRISRQAVGVGMVQHPKYNDGKPWFVNFRPTMHSPHKILDAELDAYKKFASQLEGIEATIAALKASGTDTFDVELELKLAKSKLKEGRFKMAEIYVESLSKSLERLKK